LTYFIYYYIIIYSNKGTSNSNRAGGISNFTRRNGMYAIVGNVNDERRVFGPFDTADQAREHLAANGYTSETGKFYGKGQGGTSTLFEIKEIEAPTVLVAGM